MTKCAAVLMCVSVLATACNSHTPPSTPATKTTHNPIRHDLAPLTTRFPALGDPVSASWVSGDLGDPRAPGPSLYWIDAVVEITPGTVDALKAKYHPARAGRQPEVWDTLREHLPSGEYLTGDALNAAFGTKTHAQVFLAEHEPTVVITATGE